MRQGAREGLELHCPFCRSALARPAQIRIDAIEQALGGSCGKCGALYIVDQTGKSLGAVMVQALDLMARKLSKEPTDLVLGEDYEDMVLGYDWRTHRSSGEAKGLDGHGRLYVIKAK